MVTKARLNKKQKEEEIIEKLIRVKAARVEEMEVAEDRVGPKI